MNNQTKQINFDALALKIKSWGQALGFQEIGITDTDLTGYAARLTSWLDQNYHGDMAYMQRHVEKRVHPEQLVAKTIRIIIARIDYLPPHSNIPAMLQDGHKAYISRYALGGDYHTFIRKRLALLAQKISEVAGPFGYRAFSDSAPVMEKPLAQKAGLGWIGKNTLLLNRQAGSWFFLGTLFTDLPLPLDEVKTVDHCKSCQACITICPTKAIVAPYVLDARRCISYLTIENKGAIPIEFRKALGNRIYGCDDCQLICPWNRYAKPSTEARFQPREKLDTADLVDLFNWTETDFDKKTQGSAIRRIGYVSWLRNIAVALGNAPTSESVLCALEARRHHSSLLVQEHVLWALAQHETKAKLSPCSTKLLALSKLNPAYC